MPCLQRQMHRFGAHGRAAAGGCSAAAAAAVGACRASGAQPGTAGPRAGGLLPSVVHPAHRAGGGPVSGRAAPAAVSGKGFLLPCCCRADGPPGRGKRDPQPCPQPAGLCPAVRTGGCRQRFARPAAAGAGRHRRYPCQLRGPLRRGGTQRAAGRLQEPSGAHFHRRRGRAAGQVPDHRAHRSGPAAFAAPGVYAGRGGQPVRFFRRELPVPGVQKETGQSPAQWRTMAGHTVRSGLSPEEALREQELYI